MAVTTVQPILPVLPVPPIRWSHADFTSRISVVAEEADEAVYWLDVTAGATLTKAGALGKLQQEARELTAIFSRAVGTARQNEQKR